MTTSRVLAPPALQRFLDARARRAPLAEMKELARAAIKEAGGGVIGYCSNPNEPLEMCGFKNPAECLHHHGAQAAARSAEPREESKAIDPITEAVARSWESHTLH